MKEKILSVLAFMLVGALVLSGCNKTKNNSEEENLGLANPASVYCEENGGTLIPTEDEDGNQYAFCLLDDETLCEEWEYYRGECPVTGADSSKYIKTELTEQELTDLADTNFPKSYEFTTFDMSTNQEGDSGSHTYSENIDHSLLIPEHATMSSREVVSSSIEDGMIYTLTKVTLKNGTEIQILYINNPETLNFVAASVENGDKTTNYQFQY